MVGRGEVTDRAWAQIAVFVPQTGERGGPWRDHRTGLTGILWQLRTGAPWRDLPERSGPWPTCADRRYRWRRDGTWERLRARVPTKTDAVGALDGEVGVDATIVRAHQHASGARRRPSAADGQGGLCPRRTRRADAAAGVSTTKRHLSGDGQGRPLSVVLRAGQVPKSTRFAAVLEAIRVPRPGRGRPRPGRVSADKGYSDARCRQVLRRRGSTPTIPERRDQQRRRAHRPGRRPACDATLDKRRHVVQRCSNRSKQWRGLATRYEKRAVTYRALVVIAAIMIWLAD